MRVHALIFPGQASYSNHVLDQLLSRDTVSRYTFEHAAAIASGAGVPNFGDLLLDGPAPSLRTMMDSHFVELQLAIVVGSAAAHRELAIRAPIRPGTVVVGHSLGELSALFAAGALDLEGLVTAVVSRSRAIEDSAPRGAMAAVAAPLERVEQFLALRHGDDDAAAAVVNGPQQVVVSGSAAAVDECLAVLRSQGIAGRSLAVSYPFHSPLMGNTVDVFRSALDAVQFRPLERAVYSPIERRFYTDSDDLADCLASHLVRPVYFQQAIEHLARRKTLFVECGLVRQLSRQIAAAAPEAEISACFIGDDAMQDLAAAAGLLSAGSESRRQADRRPAELVGGHAASGPAAPSGAIPARPVTISPPVSPPTNAPGNPTPANGTVPADIFQSLRELYARTLEYPAEVFTTDIDLEADLGVDSVKQSELLARAGELHGLPEPDESFKVSDYPTFGSVVEFVTTNTNAASGPENRDLAGVR